MQVGATARLSNNRRENTKYFDNKHNNLSFRGKRKYNPPCNSQRILTNTFSVDTHTNLISYSKYLALNLLLTHAHDSKGSTYWLQPGSQSATFPAHGNTSGTQMLISHWGKYSAYASIPKTHVFQFSFQYKFQVK